MRVAIVNDLRMAQEVLRRAVAGIPGATVAWIAADGAEALAMCRRDKPDLILMDMVMPVMDGAVATRAIMRECPCPILVVTSTIEGNLGLVYEALSAGALDAAQTPTLGTAGELSGGDALIRKVRVACAAVGAVEPSYPPVVAVPVVGRSQASSATRLVVIGASTGGPHAVATVIRGLGQAAPRVPCVIVQHIDLAYTEGLAHWLSHEAARQVRLARDGDTLSDGDALVAATLGHMVAARGTLRYIDAAPADCNRPSIDVLFASVARDASLTGVAILLTGMGQDGAEGLRALRDAGWHTIAQDEATSVVWGMPGSAVARGAACEVLPLSAIGAAAARAHTLALGSSR